MKLPTMPKIENFRSPRSGSPVANQIRIWIDEGVVFQSYQTIIAFAPYAGKKQLDRDGYNYSRTTMKYLNEFLGHDMKETRRRIEAGEYELVDLNK